MGNNDYYVDILFYHRELQCLVAIDLKIDDFKPEYMGKMDFYLEALDRDIKKPHENPSVGMILCKNADTDVVEYSLSRSLSQTMIAEYKTKLIDKSILQRKLAELYDIAEEDVEKAGVSSAGVYIKDVIGDNAKKAGLKSGDMIISLDGEDISGANTFISKIQDHKVGDTVKIKVKRNNKEVIARVKLQDSNEIKY